MKWHTLMVKAVREHLHEKPQVYDMLPAPLICPTSARTAHPDPKTILSSSPSDNLRRPSHLRCCLQSAMRTKTPLTSKITARRGIKCRYFFVMRMNTIVNSYRKDIATPRMMGL